MRTATILLFTLFLSFRLYAQSPDLMNYQAVVRDSEGELVSESVISLRITILQGDVVGQELFWEEHSPTTNKNGLFSVRVGSGNGTDLLSEIDWTNGPYFLKTEIDPDGDFVYPISGTTQLLSVPFAFHAKSADSLTQPLPVQKLQINAEKNSLALTDGNGVEISYVHRNSISPWSWTGYKTIGYDGTATAKKISLYQQSDTLSLYGVTSTQVSTSQAHNKWVVGVHGAARGIGEKAHIGVYGISGDLTKYNMNGDAKYGVVGISADSINGYAHHTGMYGYAHGHETTNYGVDGTATSTIGDNYGVSGWAYGLTTGKNYGLYGYATGSTTENYAVFGTINNPNTNRINYSGYFKNAPVGIENDNLYIKDSTKGIIMTSPNGTCWQVTVDNTGGLVTNSVTCPK